MIKTTTYKQTDSLFGLFTIGFGLPLVDTFRKIGCTVTSLANLSSVLTQPVTPSQMNENMRIVKGFAPDPKSGRRILVIWEAAARLLGLQFVGRYRTYTAADDKKVKASIAKGLPVMVEFQHPSGIRHWCLAVGDKKIVDPLKGIVPFSTYRPTGYVLFNKL
jgi:hypothetical protein